MLMGLFDNKHKIEEDRADRALRPTNISEYIGQNDLINILDIAISAANERKDPVEHILLSGPPGLGKTTIANIISRICGSSYYSVSAPSIRSLHDLISLLIKLRDRDVLFIDEIHSINIKLEEMLYSAMEDYTISVKLPNNSINEIPLRRFCLIGATTKPGVIDQPLRDRFGIMYNMQFYSSDELSEIIYRNCKKLKLNVVDEESVSMISVRSRGTPRIANRLLRRVRDFAQVRNNGSIDKNAVSSAMDIEGVDEIGLTKIDKRYLDTIFRIYNCGPCGIEPIAASCGEDKSTISDYIEPYLVRIGFVARTPRGRILTTEGMNYVIEKLR